MHIINRFWRLLRHWGKLKSLKLIIKELPKIDKYPLELPYNGAFHTPLMNDISKKALKFSESLIFKNQIFLC